MDGLMMDYPLTVPYLLDRAARYFPDIEVVSRRPDRSVARSTYAEVRRRAHQLAGALARLGVGSSERVATLGWNHAPPGGLLRRAAAGGVLHTLNLRLPLEEYRVHREPCRRLDFYSSTTCCFRLAGEDARQVEFRARLRGAAGRAAPSLAGYEDYEALLAAGAGGVHLLTPRREEPLGICYTSGTTGRPQGRGLLASSTIVLHSFFGAARRAAAIAHRDGSAPVVPMFHVNAWGIPFAALCSARSRCFRARTSTR